MQHSTLFSNLQMRLMLSLPCSSVIRLEDGPCGGTSSTLISTPSTTSSSTSKSTHSSTSSRALNRGFISLSLCLTLLFLLSRTAVAIAAPSHGIHCRGGADPSDGKECKGVSDHVWADVYSKEVGLSEKQIQMIKEAAESPMVTDEKLRSQAKETHMDIGPHIAFRYFVSCEWASTFHGKKVQYAIVDTVRWRSSFHSKGVHRIDPGPIKHLIQRGLAYTAGTDKKGRVMMMFKAGRNDKKLYPNNDVYLDLLIYTVEKADKMSVSNGVGEFVAVVDLDGLSLFNGPPISVIKSALSLLKHHYPYRLAGIFIINAGSPFVFLWNIIKPLMPPRALKKTFVVDSSETNKVLQEQLGVDYIEDTYGGKKKEQDWIGDMDAYVKEGFWFQH